MNGLCHKSSLSGRLFLSLPLLFSFTNVNNVQSWPIVFLKKVNVWITLEAKKMSGYQRIWPDKSYFWPDIVRWPAVISSPVATLSKFYQVSRQAIRLLNRTPLEACTKYLKFYTTLTIFRDSDRAVSNQFSTPVFSPCKLLKSIPVFRPGL